MKKVRSTETLFGEKSSYLKLKHYSPKINSKEWTSKKGAGESVLEKQKISRSRTYLYKQLQTQFKELKDEYTIIVEENKQNVYEYDSQKKQIQRLKADHEKNLKQIQRLNLLINLVKKKDQGNQVNTNQWSKGSWFTREKSTEGEIMRETMRDLWIPKQQNNKKYRTLYQEKQKQDCQELGVHTTLQRISRKRNNLDWDQIGKQSKINTSNKTNRMNKRNYQQNEKLYSINSPKKALNFAEIKRLSNSPYSRINFTKK